MEKLPSTKPFPGVKMSKPTDIDRTLKNEGLYTAGGCKFVQPL